MPLHPQILALVENIQVEDNPIRLEGLIKELNRLLEEELRIVKSCKLTPAPFDQQKD